MASKYNMEFGVPTTPRRRRRVEIAIGIGLIVLFAVGGFLIGYFLMEGTEETNKCQDGKDDAGPTGKPNMEKYHQMFQEEIRAVNIENNLKFYTSKPHTAGSDRQRELAEHLATKWREYGFDDVEMPEYRALLSVPQEDKPNKVEIINNGTVEHTILGKIKVSAEPGASETFDYFPYFAYAPNGTVSGELVYMNSGGPEDLAELEKRNISLTGKIVIVRGRFALTNLATSKGAIGALVFPDVQSNDTYPNTQWTSGDAVFERPMSKRLGDPLTPEIPAIKGMYREPRDDKLFGSIPVQPISFNDAMYLLSRLQGEVAPEKWQSGMNITIRFGPGFNTTNTTIRLQVNNQFMVKSIFNVIGTIHGREEPDRYVLIGSHRDAWLFGAADPSSGTAALTEITRAVGMMLQQGWRPRRTMKFCSWGGEEFGLIGSVEWVEQHVKILQERAVAYLNTDVAVGGSYVLVSQNGPLLTKAIFSWAKKVRDPNAHGSKTSLYDIMVERNPSKMFPGEPNVVPYKFLSDYLPFILYAGIPSADFSYFFGPNNGLYPVYHTQEDSFYWMKTFIDPKFELHEAVTKFEGGLLIDLADTPVLPFDVVRYAHLLLKRYETFVPYMKPHNISTEYVQDAIMKFVNASVVFDSARSNLNSDTASPLVLRMFNDQMVQVEKAFISSSVKSSNFLTRHTFARNNFAGVYYALLQKDFDEVKRQWSFVATAITSATEILSPM